MSGDLNQPIGCATSDQEFLDDVLSRFMDSAEEGLAPDASSFALERPHLAGQLADLARVAFRLNSATGSVPPRLGGYDVLREIGRGGMGAVYLARQHSLGDRVVALKVLGESSSISTRSRTRFRAEAATVAKLRHANIVTIYDVVDEETTCAFSMEWIPGGSLARVIERVKAARESRGRPDDMRAVRTALGLQVLSPDGEVTLPDASYAHLVCRLGMAIARALGEVHRAGVLHRDVKPSNILIRPDGTPLLTDFGLAREVDASFATEAGEFVGTAAYASPEQLRGEREALDARTDVYSLGATLWHALTLRPPFVGGSSAAVLLEMERARSRERAIVPPPCPAVTPEARLPRDLRLVLTKAMEYDAARRYTSADELADDLERFLTLRPVRARRAGLVERGVKLLRRNRLWLAGAATATAVALAVCALALVQFLAVPVWKERAIRTARLAMIHPSQRAGVQSALFWGAERRDDRIDAPAESLGDAVSSWTRVPWSARLTRREQAERDTVFAVWRLANRQPGSGNLPGLDATSAYVDAWSSGRGAPDLGPILARCRDSDDRRCLGLAAFLCRDWSAAFEVWTAELSEPGTDPLLDAALGQLLLEQDQPALAYVRLHAAFKALPEATALRVDIADAALGIGAVAEAGRLTEELLGTVAADPFRTIHRVRADLNAALATAAMERGDGSEAERLVGLAEKGEPGPAPVGYSQLMNDRFVPTGALHYARSLARWGRDRDSLEAYLRLVRTCPDVPRFRVEFERQAERWWSLQDPAARVSLLRGALENDSWFSALAAARALAAREHGDPAAPRATLSAFSPGASLLSVALALGADRMDALTHLRAAPAVCKDLAAPALLTPFAGFAVKALSFAAAASGGRLARDHDLFRLVDLGLTGGLYAEPGLDELGEVTGHVGGTYGLSFVWREGVTRTFGGACTTARDMNSSGVIAGWSDCPGAPTLWRGPAFTRIMLPIPPGFRGHKEAHEINDAGTVAGHLHPGPGPEALWHPYFWTPRADGSYGPPRPLGVPGGVREYAHVQDMNDAGLIVGTAHDENMSPESLRGVVWLPTADGYAPPLQLPSPWDRPTLALRVNNAGVIVGRVVDDRGEPHAVAWRGGEMVELGFRGTAVCINDRGVIVLSGTWPSLLNDGRVTALAGRIRDAQNFAWFTAERINSAGLIAGTGLTTSGSYRTVVLTPIEESPKRGVDLGGTRSSQRNVRVR